MWWLWQHGHLLAVSFLPRPYGPVLTADELAVDVEPDRVVRGHIHLLLCVPLSRPEGADGTADALAAALAERLGVGASRYNVREEGSDEAAGSVVVLQVEPPSSVTLRSAQTIATQSQALLRGGGQSALLEGGGGGGDLSAIDGRVEAVVALGPPPEDAARAPPADPRLSAVLAAAAVASVVCVLCVPLLYCCCRRCRKRRDGKDEERPINSDEGDSDDANELANFTPTIGDEAKAYLGITDV